MSKYEIIAVGLSSISIFLSVIVALYNLLKDRLSLHITLDQEKVCTHKEDEEFYQIYNCKLNIFNKSNASFTVIKIELLLDTWQTALSHKKITNTMFTLVNTQHLFVEPYGSFEHFLTFYTSVDFQIPTKTKLRIFTTKGNKKLKVTLQPTQD